MTATPTLVQTPKITPASWVNADGANAKKTVCTAGSSGSKVVGLTATSTDTSNRTGQVWLTRSSVSYLLASFVVPTLAGTDGAVQTVNLLMSFLWPLPTDNDGQRYLFLESGDTLQVSFTAAVTSAKEIDVACIFGNF